MFFSYPGGFTLHGGKLNDGSLSDELWYFEASTKEWSLRATNSSLTPPKLARHTLTLANNGWLYLIGGSRPDGHFSSSVFRIKLSKGKPQWKNNMIKRVSWNNCQLFNVFFCIAGGTEQWEEVRAHGGKALDVRVVAHSTIFYSSSLLVYGGIVASVARFSKLSDRMFAFNVLSRHWAEIHYPRAQLRDTYVPRERAFHTATLIG